MTIEVFFKTHFKGGNLDGIVIDDCLWFVDLENAKSWIKATSAFFKPIAGSGMKMNETYRVVVDGQDLDPDKWK